MKIIIYTDGGARGNPGPAGIGVVIASEQGQIIKEYAEYIGRATNNEAEYQALIFALKKVKLLFGKKKIKDIEMSCFLDSELATKQLNHQYKIQEEHLQNLFMQIWNLTLDFKNVSFTHIRREKNKAADRLVNQVLDEKGENLSLEI